MSIKIISTVFNDISIKGNEKLLMIALADNANDSGVCFPSWNSLIRKTSMSKGTLSKCLNMLEEKKLIFRKARARKNGGKSSNKYLLYPSINYENLDEEDLILFEDFILGSSEVEQGDSSKDEHAPSSEVELECEPSPISLNHHFLNHHSSPTLKNDEANEVARYLLKVITDYKPNFKPRAFSQWEKDIDKAMRIDKRTKEQLITCIDWIYSSQKGNFWIPNILSGKKLREKFDTMEAQALSQVPKQKDIKKEIEDDVSMLEKAFPDE